MYPNPLNYKNVLALLLLACTMQAFTQTTGTSGTGANLDVKYYRCNWTVDPRDATKTLTGSVTIYFETRQNSVSTINFDLNKASFNNGSLVVTYHGSTIAGRSFPSSGNVNILNIPLPAAITPINRLDSVTISYSGAPPASSGEAIGYQRGTGNNIYTLSESYEDRDWWPCKGDMQDKADSMDIIVTTPWSTPDTFWVAANGKLTDSTITGGNRKFTFKVRYPIASYLVAIGVAKYNRYYRGTVNIGGTNVPVVYNIYAGKTAATYTSMLTALDKSKIIIDTFSKRFGDYPFKNEKHGYYEFGWGGGMEHQSFSGMGASAMTSVSTIAHELMHQWFGDKVTFSSWSDLWLAEGFARYSEILTAEQVPASGLSVTSMRSSLKSAAIGTALRTTSVYIPTASASNSDGIWAGNYGSTVYERGGMVVSMLRAMMGDAKFFQACRNYLSSPGLAYRSATTDSLRHYFEALSGGKNLKPFFDDYVVGTGNPAYTINWGYNPGYGRFIIQVANQTRSTGSSVSYFHSPIVLRVQGSIAAQDTMVVIYDNNGSLSYAGDGVGSTVSGTTIGIPISFSPVTVTFDPNNVTMATGTVAKVISLPTEIIDFHATKRQLYNEISLTLSEDKAIQRAVVQKSSNGIDFTDAGNMIKTGASGLINHYDFEDRHPYAGTTWYRVRIIDTDGSVLFTRIVKLQEDVANSLLVSPNPADKEVTIRWNGPIGNRGVIQIINAAGEVQWHQQAEQGSTRVNITRLVQGVYIVQLLQNGSVIASQRLVVQR